MKPDLACQKMKSPFGEIQLVAKSDALIAILWENEDPKRVGLPVVPEDPSHPVLLETERQLTGYFAGTLRAFSVKLDFMGTDFQKAVWQALLTIPYGETRSYREIATQIGNSQSVRAVGGAIGKNPISIITPCHRVLGANGKLTGFAGGLEAKAMLLRIESSASRQ